MTPRTVAALAAIAALCAACSDPKKANEANFAEALNQYLVHEGRLCIRGLAREWPHTLLPGVKPARDRFGNSPNRAMRLDALAQAGLLKSEEVVVSPRDPAPSLRYHLTDAAKPFLLVHKSDVMRGIQDLCFATRAVDKVLQWEGPMSFGAYQVANVAFTWRVRDVAEWAKHPAVKDAFPEIERELTTQDRSGREQVHLTSNGWRAGRSDP
jgi:hypothetical protein